MKAKTESQSVDRRRQVSGQKKETKSKSVLGEHWFYVTPKDIIGGGKRKENQTLEVCMGQEVEHIA